MKYQQSEKYFETSCKECIFAIYDNITQVNCVAGRTDKFVNKIEAYDNDKEFYVINRICNYHTKSKIEENIIDNLERIKQEKRIKIDVYIDFGDANNDSYVDAIIKFYNNLSEIDKKNTYYNLLLNNQSYKIYEFSKNIINLNRYCIEVQEKNFRNKYQKTFKQAFHMQIKNIDDIPSIDFFNKVEKEINENLIQCCVFQENNSILLSSFGMMFEYQKDKELNNGISYLSYDEIKNNLIAYAKKSNLYKLLT